MALGVSVGCLLGMQSSKLRGKDLMVAATIPQVCSLGGMKEEEVAFENLHPV